MVFNFGGRAFKFSPPDSSFKAVETFKGHNWEAPWNDYNTTKNFGLINIEVPSRSLLPPFFPPPPPPLPPPRFLLLLLLLLSSCSSPPPPLLLLRARCVGWRAGRPTQKGEEEQARGGGRGHHGEVDRRR